MTRQLPIGKDTSKERNAANTFVNFALRSFLSVVSPKVAPQPVPVEVTTLTARVGPSRPYR